MATHAPELRPVPPLPRRRRRAVALIYLTVMLAALCAFALLAVDVGRAYAVKNELQGVADAAARAAAHAMATGGPAAARQAAVDIAAFNSVNGQRVVLNPASSVTLGNWDAGTRTWTPLSGAAEKNANAVAILLSRTKAAGNAVPLTFGPIVGLNTVDVSARSTACAPGNNSAYAIVGINSLTITGNGMTDSYDSSKGPYTEATARHKGSIASNGDISMTGSALIDGDVRSGVGKKATIGGAAVATGLVAPLGTPLNFPSVTLPASYIDAGDCIMSSGKVSLPGGVYVFDTFDLSGSAHIAWEGPVVIYVRKAYKVSGRVVIDTYKNIPANRVIKFLPTCKTATWTGNHSCVGELYAPDTDFTIGGNAELFGRIVAKTISLSSSGGLHYDEALPPVGQESTGPSSVTLVR